MNNSGERGEHANNIDHSVAAKLLNVLSDGSPIVRKVSLPFPHIAHIYLLYYVSLSASNHNYMTFFVVLLTCVSLSSTVGDLQPT